MAEAAVQIENVGKRYAISHKQRAGTRTLRDEIAHGVVSAGRRLLRRGGMSAATQEEFWALRDLSFRVQQGELIGIIGRNGAGKSTLLKLLSRITEPTTGRIAITGRLASLLEVGTGFHSELTGRENIFLNGAILGMSKAEIRRKFDEIVAFSEVDKFLDTPVKRYSSGMYVRLAFSVAAHLEPDILIVDEVLAVGDAAFQKKCIAKMQDVTRSQGRTVLFVSHNMETIQRLCDRCIALDQGLLVDDGDPAEVILRYLSGPSSEVRPNQWLDISHVARTGTGEARFAAIHYSSRNEALLGHPYSTGPLDVMLAIDSDSARSVDNLAVTIYDNRGTKLVNADTESIHQVLYLRKGRNTIKVGINNLFLNPGVYTLGLWINDLARPRESGPFDYLESACKIEILDSEPRESRTRDKAPVTCHFKVADLTHDM